MKRQFLRVGDFSTTKLQKSVSTLESSVRIVATIASIIMIVLSVLIQPIIFGIPGDTFAVIVQTVLWFAFSIVPFLFAIGSYFASPWLIERKLNMKPMSEVFPEVEQLVHELSKIEGIDEPPRSYLEESQIPECYVFGRRTRNAKLIITRGLIDDLTPKEREAAILHELAHIRNRDMSFMTWSVTFVKALKYWILVFFVTFFVIQALINVSALGRPRFYSTNLFFSLFLVVIPILCVNSVSRVRELLADARASLFLQNSSDLVSAIRKCTSTKYLYTLLRYKKARKARQMIWNLLSLKWIPHVLAKYTTKHHPFPYERAKDLVNEKYIIGHGKLRLPSIETSTYAGLIAFYFMLIGTLLNFLGAKIFGSILLLVFPIAIILFLNNFAIKNSDIVTLFDNSPTKTQFSFLFGMFTRNLISFATLFFATVFFFILGGVGFSAEAIEAIIGTVVIYGICLLVSILFSLVFLLIRYFKK